jgi:glycosyltransferase involved in cell wall biosynthesis
MFRVCMLVHKYYDDDPRVRRYVEALLEAGAEVDVLCLHALGRQKQRSAGKLRVVAIPFARGGRRARYLIEYGVAFVLYLVWLLAMDLRRQYTVIHVHNMPDFLVFAALIPRLRGAKIIHDIHDPMPEFYMSKHRHATESLVVQLMQLQERLALPVAHAVITANAAFKTNLVQRGLPAEAVTVVNNVADPRIFDRAHYPTAQRQAQAGFTLLYPGTVAPRYGLHIALQALPILVPEIPGLRLRIIGPGEEYLAALADQAAALGVAEHVELVPPIAPTEVPYEMMHADLGIYPALPDPHMTIATPSKVYEYVAMGLPVIASRLSALEVLFDDSTIFYVRPNDPVAFAHGVLSLYADPARRSEQARRAQARLACQRSWAQERQRYFALLHSLVR